MASFIRSEVDLFSIPAKDGSVISSEYQPFYPISDVKNGSYPLEFTISGNGVRYIDPFESFLYLKVHITKEDGTKLDATDVVAPGNLFLHTLFSDCSVEINGIKVSQSKMHPYQSWMRTQLSYGSELKDSELTSLLYYKDTAPDEYDPAKNSSFKTRLEFAQESKPFELIGRLCDGIFTQKRYLPPNVNLNITLRLSLIHI